MTVMDRVQLLDFVYETAYPPRMRLPEHAHHSAYLCFVKEGSFSERHGHRVETYDRSWSMFRPSNDEHANEFHDAGAVCVNVDLGMEWLDRFRELGLAGRRFGVQSPFVAQLSGRLYDELRAPDSVSGVVVESLVAEILVFALRTRDRHRTGWMEKAQRMIHSEFTSPLSLGAIAAAVGIHPVHLARQFRAVHGCTVGDYIREVRIAFARRQLATTDAPIAKIALDSGFFDQSQLTKAFKRVTGRTPAAYRAGRR